MNCRKFERLTADWENGRLFPELSRNMAAHRKTCPACAHKAAAEAQLRAAWRDAATPSPAADLWPRLAQRLDVPDLVVSRRPRWALATAMTLMILGLCSWTSILHNRTSLERTQPGHIAPGLSGPAARSDDGSPSGRSAARSEPPASDSWSVLSDVSQNTALVDDPVGMDTDNVWTYLKTDGK